MPKALPVAITLIIILSIVGAAYFLTSGIIVDGQDIKVMRPYYGSINCEISGDIQNFDKSSSVGWTSYICTGHTCTAKSIEPVDWSWTCESCLFKDKFDMEFVDPSQCTFNGYNDATSGTFGSLPYNFARNNQITVSNVRCKANIYFYAPSGRMLITNPSGYAISEKCTNDGYCYADNFVLTGQYQPLELVKYFDSARMPIENTQQCTFQNVWTQLNEGIQIQSSGLANIIKAQGVFMGSGSATQFYSGDYQPQSLPYGGAILYIQEWKETSDYNVKEYNNQYVQCLPTGAVYSLSEVDTISGKKYFIPTTLVKSNAECCFDTGACTIKYGAGWFCDQTTFMCEQQAGCSSDLECNSAGKGVCVIEDGIWYFYDSSCVNGQCQGIQHERVGYGMAIECCKLPYDTCPKNTDPPQYCGDDYKCHVQTTPTRPCPNECCVGMAGYTEKTCASIGQFGKICCNGLCKTETECYGICNHDGVCDDWETATCPDCQGGDGDGDIEPDFDLMAILSLVLLVAGLIIAVIIIIVRSRRRRR